MQDVEDGTGVVRKLFARSQLQIPAEAGTTVRTLDGFKIWGEAGLPERAEAQTTYSEKPPIVIREAR